MHVTGTTVMHARNIKSVVQLQPSVEMLRCYVSTTMYGDTCTESNSVGNYGPVHTQS